MTSQGYYKSWHCESAAHAARSPSPHGMNRICSNDKLSAAGVGEYPTDSASVKELFYDAGKNVVGYAVYCHVTAGTTGATWQLWPRADDLRQLSPVICQLAAGSDSNHSGHDFVYTHVK